jgi:hypothetical protein
MAEERTTNVTLNAKGMEAYISDGLAEHLFGRPGERRLLLIEVHTNKRVLNENGTRRVHLSIDDAEVIPEEHETRFRDVMRALYLNRPDDSGQERMPIEGEMAQKPEDALDAAAAPIEATEEPDADDDPAPAKTAKGAKGKAAKATEEPPEGWDGNTEPESGDESDSRVLSFSAGAKK